MRIISRTFIRVWIEMVIDDDYNVLISIESSYGQVTQCKYIKDQFKRV